MSRAIRFCSLAEPTGYGLAAVAYVRGLVNAGVPLHWDVLVSRGEGLQRLAPGAAPPLLEDNAEDDALRDLPALLAATSRPIAHSTVVAHTVPEHWPGLFADGRRNIGCTVWEADAPPPHWVPLLNSASAVCVPCQMNQAAFLRAGVIRPLHVVPHIRRHAWNDFTAAELDELRRQLGIPPDHFVFYSISTWEPRKAIPRLIEAYVRAFDATDPVTLVIKTEPSGFGEPPYYPIEPTPVLAQAAIDRARADKAAPAISLLPYRLTGRGIDLLHALGDCYVSLAHGEGWALGAFDAATRGTPVIMTGWGGQLDYLGGSWPGALPYRLAKVPAWPPQQPSYWPSQRWAEADLSAAASALRMASTRPAHLTTSAMSIADSIAERYAEPVVTRALLDAIDA